MLSKKELKKFRDAREELHKKDEPYRRAANSDFIIYLLTLMAVAIFIRTFIFEPVQCIGISMYPTLVGGEGMFTEKLTYTVSAPQRDDIIICRYPYHTEKCVKRVIAVPGDRISISDGAIYLNGERLDESAYWSGYIEDSEMPEVTVPERNLFVVGDNRNNSKDSRSPMVGALERRMIKGHVRCVVFPLNKARILGE